MRLFTLCILFFSYVSAQTLSLESRFEESFNHYNNVELVSTKGVRDSFNNLKNAKSDLAVVRADILFLAHAGKDNLNFKDYTIISKLKEASYLYFVAKEGVNVSRITDLRGKKVSIGHVEDMANLHLKKVLNTVEGVEQNVYFKAYDLNTSLEMIKSGTLDFLFAFGNKEFANEITKRGLVRLDMPKEFMDVLRTNKGFNTLTNEIKIDNYLLVANSISEESLISLIKEIKEKGLLLTQVDETLGQLPASISKVIEEIKIQEEIDKEDKEKMEKVAKALQNIKKEKRNISKVISKIKKEASKIKSESTKFFKTSLKLTYERKAKQILKKIGIEKKKIDLKSSSLNDLKEDKNVEELEGLVKELQAINITLSTYANDAEDVTGEIQIKLSEQEEAEAEQALSSVEGTF